MTRSGARSWPCGARQPDENQSGAIIEIGRREGQVILPDAA
jgi:hypothetical protein